MVAEIAIVLWILASLVLFALLPPLRAFLLTYVVGILFLPVELHSGVDYVGSIAISQSLHIDKLAACNIGVLFGTIFFAPHLITRFRFHWVDAVYLAVVVGMFLTSLTNGLGAKDGLSNGVDNLRAFLPVIVLTRMHITSVTDLYQAMRALIAGALVYSVICIIEFRFAPQLHRMVYGYFQHSFDQFMRYDHFRPAGFLRHAIELSFFMGTTAALAAWLWFKGMLRSMWGLPGWAVAAALVFGLTLTMTFAGYAAFLICCTMFGASLLLRTRWILVILPMLAIGWMAGRYFNVIDASSLLQAAAYLDPHRSESLEYRLEAERLNLVSASESLLLGKSAQQAIAVHDDGSVVMAVDAWWLVTFTFYGLVGLGGWYLVWSAGLLSAFFKWRQLTPDVRILSIAVAVLIGAQFIDFLFNSFPSVLLLILDMGLVGAVQHYKPMPAIAPWMMMQQEPPVPEVIPQGVPGL
ncbi:MAG TPA: hypothetical protein VM008_15820 [Phycisphaerae bacterium]|nr:hypothetical protein [Phycisphaerae bacterium]